MPEIPIEAAPTRKNSGKNLFRIARQASDSALRSVGLNRKASAKKEAQAASALQAKEAESHYAYDANPHSRYPNHPSGMTRLLFLVCYYISIVHDIQQLLFSAINRTQRSPPTATTTATATTTTTTTTTTRTLRTTFRCRAGSQQVTTRHQTILLGRPSNPHQGKFSYEPKNKPWPLPQPA